MNNMSSFAQYLECFCPVLGDCPKKRIKEYDSDASESDDDYSEYSDDSEYDEDDSDDEEYEAGNFANNAAISDQNRPILTMIQNLTMNNILHGAGNGERKPMMQGIVVMRRGDAADGEKPSVESTFLTEEDEKKDEEEGEPCNIKPIDTLKSILKKRNSSILTIPWTSYTNFVQRTPEHVAGYSMALNDAVRQNNVDAVRALYEAGNVLQCCNQFGESVMHIAARRGHLQVLEYLVKGAPQCSLRVVCDSGRTPLHDACWTSTPNFDCIKLILQQCPDFFLIADNRNFTPLDYVPRGCWRKWNTFLEQNPDLVKPRLMYM